MTSSGAAEALRTLSPVQHIGRARLMTTTHVEADGPLCSLGDVCAIDADQGAVLAEVAAVKDARVTLVPYEQHATIRPGARVSLLAQRGRAPVGPMFSGRIIDPFGAPLDGGGPVFPESHVPIEGSVLAPLEREEPKAVLETGIRAIDGFLPLGRGQRIGVFSASGVGKTTLIRQLALQIACDRIVICLVGERGREVELIWRELSRSARHSVVTCVAATSDRSAPLRTRAVAQAVALAEHWRDAGEHVLLIVDSATRYAMALREIGLAAGAPPTQRAYTPNVFSALPRLVERCGASRASGAITAVFTILAETDDVDDPIAELMKSLLDGHIVLSRSIAEQGRYPAIDILRSISRQSERVSTPHHMAAAKRALSALATFEDARLLIESGVYKTGASIDIDAAIRERPQLIEFLKQGSHESTRLADTIARLSALSLGRRPHA